MAPIGAGVFPLPIPMEFDSIQLRVSDEYGHHRGRIVRLWQGSDGASMIVAFPLEAGPALPLGRGARIDMSGGPFGAPVETSGLVVARRDGPDQDEYQFRFGDAARGVIGLLFEARRDPRVGPPEGRTVTVALRSLDGGARPVACHLVDLSVGGIAVRVPPASERELATTFRVRLALPLEGGSEPLVLDGEIRRRALERDDVVYGLEFVGWQEGDPRRRRLDGYVQQRLSERRSANETSGAHRRRA